MVEYLVEAMGGWTWVSFSKKRDINLSFISKTNPAKIVDSFQLSALFKSQDKVKDSDYICNQNHELIAVIFDEQR